MNLDPKLIEALNAVSPYAALIVVVVLFIGLISFGIRSMNMLAATLHGFTANQQQIAVALATVTTTLQNYAEKMDDIVDRSRETVDEIAQLRLDLDKHIVAINVRFDQLPTQVQQAVIGEWMRYAQNGHGTQRRGLLARLFG